MAGESGIDHALDLRMLLEPGSAVHRVAAMALHAQRQRLDAAQRQERIEWARHAADRVLQEAELFLELLVLTDDCRAADHIGMSIDVFGRGVDYNVEAMLQRPLDPGRGEGVVAYASDVLAMCDLGDG